MAGKKIAVVTGGAGFIGSHMVDLLLNEGFQVRVIDNLTGGRLANLAHHKSNTDLTVDTRDLRSLKPDDKLFSDAQFVFHYAGKGDIVPSIVQPLEYMSVNVMGTIHALECARAAGRCSSAAQPCSTVTTVAGRDRRASSRSLELRPMRAQRWPRRE